MGISDRLYNLAKSYLDSARTRWDEVDPAAQQELDNAVSSPALTAWERAQAKINAAKSSNQAVQELRLTQAPQPANLPPIQQAAAAQPSQNTLAAAYKILGLPEGSDLLTAQKAYQDLQKKADPAQFPEGSQDRKLAQDLHRRVNAAYMMLANALSAPSDDRFDRLEL